MLLDAATKSLELLLAGAVTTNQLPVVAFYIDHTSTAATPGESDTQSNGATAVAIVAAPAASTQRQVKSISIFNADTVAATVTVRLNNNSTYRSIVKQILQPDQTLLYLQETGWSVVQGGNGILQVVSTFTGEVATGTTAMPGDDTIPQNTEGDQFLSLAITPKISTSKLWIHVVAALMNNSGASAQGLALFQDTTANALAVTWYLAYANSYFTQILNHIMTSGTTSATTFKVRSGNHGGGTTTFNGYAGTRFYGGKMASGIIITEMTA
jgi:hypothetical protein